MPWINDEQEDIDLMARFFGEYVDKISLPRMMEVASVIQSSSSEELIEKVIENTFGQDNSWNNNNIKVEHKYPKEYFKAGDVISMDGCSGNYGFSVNAREPHNYFYAKFVDGIIHFQRFCGSYSSSWKAFDQKHSKVEKNFDFMSKFMYYYGIDLRNFDPYTYIPANFKPVDR